MTDQKKHLDGNLMQAYLDGVLELSEIQLFEDHLESCPICQEELSRLEILNFRLDSLPEIKLSQDLSTLVIAQLKDQQALSPVITWTLIIEALAAGTVVGLLIPAIQAAGWLPRLLGTGIEIQAAVNIFLHQLASNWLVWWAGLNQQIRLFIPTLLPKSSLLESYFSPWLMIGITGGLAILINLLLLGGPLLPNQNHKRS